MRTKTLLIAAAALAVSAGISMAQTYSQNVVGYVNLTLGPTGYTAVTIPLDADGTGSNNPVLTVVGTNVPNGTYVQTWNGSSYGTPNTFGPTTKNTIPHWTTPGANYNPGIGLFVNNPSNFPVTVTIVGTVLQGNLTNAAVTAAGYSLVGSQFPVQGGVTTTYGYVPVNTDYVLTWTGSGFSAPNTFGPTTKNTIPHWTSGEPQIGVGLSVFLYTTNAHPLWATNFVVQ
jgi:hypothetical protein